MTTNQVGRAKVGIAKVGIAKVGKAKVGRATAGGTNLIAGLIAGILQAAYGRQFKVSADEVFVAGSDRITFNVEW